LDGVYFKNEILRRGEKKEGILFKKLKALSDEDIREVNLKIKKRFIRTFRKRGLVEGFEEGKTQFIFPEFNNFLQ
jgi:bisphosphoglycerate-dependent phosphoglycerate mutase